MILTSEISRLQVLLNKFRLSGKTIGFVPTMGFLHEGHLELVRHSKLHCDITVVSVFVNPTQFNASEDLDTYPRNEEDDIRKLEELSVDIIFMPTVEQIYPEGSNTCKVILPDSLSKILCGITRPHFFNGVAQVIVFLFNIIRPDIVCLGEKDRQQLVIIKKVIRDFHFNIKIISVPTVRDESGLALSSRNAYLNESEKLIAPVLNQVLKEAVDDIKKNNFSSLDEICNYSKEKLKSRGFIVEYFEVRNLNDLSLDTSSDIGIFTACWLGRTRLIDNYPIIRSKAIL